MNNKYIIILPILALCFSCKKENEEIMKPEQPLTTEAVTVIATINNEDEPEPTMAPEVKTTYEIDEVNHRAIFYWKGDESFARVIRHNSGDKPYDLDYFTSSGEKVESRTFSCDSPKTGDPAYEDSKIAFYPNYEVDSKGANISFDTGRNDSHFYYSIGGELTYDKDAPLDGIVPMVGYYDDVNEEYDFKPLTGILAIRMTGIPASATKLTISSASYNMAGKTMKITDQTALSILQSTIKTFSYDKGLCQSLLATNLSKSKTFTFSGLDPNEEYTFYFPLPISTNHNSGTTTLNDLKVTLYQGGNAIYTMSTTKSLTIKRGTITRLPLITCAPKKARVYNDANNPYFEMYHFPSITTVFANISTSATNNPSEYQDGFYLTSHPINYRLRNWTGTGKLQNSGQYYLHYIATDLSSSAKATSLSGLNDSHVLDYGTIPFYYINDTDKNAIVSQYVRDITSGSFTVPSGWESLDVHGDNTITLAVADDCNKGNIMITEFAGFCYDVSQNTFSTNAYDFSQFMDGKPVYGCYSQSYTYTQSTTTYGAKFFDLKDQTFYKDASSSNHNLGTEQKANTELDITFNSDGYTPGTYHDLVVWDNYIGNNYGNNLTDFNFYFTHYVAFKTKGMITLTGSMLSTNSSYGEGGDGDAGGMAALVDKNASTRWHSNYNESIATDNHGIYIQINLSSISKTVKDFTLKFLSRGDASHGLPSKYRVAVSNNGTDWSFLTEEDIPITAAPGTWYQKSLSAGANYSYIRLCITEINHNDSSEGTQTLTNTTADGSRYTHLAEIQLWEN